jgi:hypothetical protein
MKINNILKFLIFFCVLRQAIRVLGESSFKKCYEYLKAKRSNYTEEGKVFEGLKSITTHPSDCFLVDQLIFLEEQSK